MGDIASDRCQCLYRHRLRPAKGFCALNDIALQIATHIESNSFMHTVDIDGKSRELFEDKIKSSVVSYLEGQKLVDSYQNERNYYVYYSLDKVAYERTIQKHKRTAISTGLDYYNKAQQALDANSLVTAVQLAVSGSVHYR